ncbi:MAG: hypothetical protein ACRDOA_02465 [Streptosporangiaceae bacterium]
MRRGDRGSVAAVLVGLAVLAAYLLPGLSHPGTRWPLWDARVYWWGGQQAARGGPLYASGGPFNFTYPPFAASLFRLGAGPPWRSWPSLIGWTMAWSPEVRLPSHQTRRPP